MNASDGVVHPLLVRARKIINDNLSFWSNRFQRKFFYALVGLIMPFTGSEAVADLLQLKTGQSGVWTLVSYSKTATGDFSHCAGARRTSSGLTAIFSVYSSTKWNIAFIQDSWRLSPGTSYSGSISVDVLPPRVVESHAITSRAVYIDLPADRELFQQIRLGGQLHVNLNLPGLSGAGFSVPLTGTSAMLQALLSCVANRGEIIDPSYPSRHSNVPQSSGPGPGWIKGGGALHSDGGEDWIHLESSVRYGDIVRVWIIQNYARPGSLGFMSQRLQNEYDCVRYTWRVLYLSMHSEHNARGTVIRAGPSPDTRWDPAAPETVGFNTLRMVCRG